MAVENLEQSEGQSATLGDLKYCVLTHPPANPVSLRQLMSWESKNCFCSAALVFTSLVNLGKLEYLPFPRPSSSFAKTGLARTITEMLGKVPGM